MAKSTASEAAVKLEEAKKNTAEVKLEQAKVAAAAKEAGNSAFRAGFTPEGKNGETTFDPNKADQYTFDGTNTLKKASSSGLRGGSADKQTFEEKKFLAGEVQRSENLARQMYNGQDEFGNKVNYDPNKYDSVMKEVAVKKMAYTLHNTGSPINDAESTANVIMNSPFSYEPPFRKDLPIVKDAKTGQWALSLQYPGLIEKLAMAAKGEKTAKDVLDDAVSRLFPSSLNLQSNQAPK
jgi:hypothetical protein